VVVVKKVLGYFSIFVLDVKDFPPTFLLEYEGEVGVVFDGDIKVLRLDISLLIKLLLLLFLE
jgi:hypothetical protein